MSAGFPVPNWTVGAYGRFVGDGPDSRYNAEIHQAAWIVSVQADCELEQSYEHFLGDCRESPSGGSRRALALLRRHGRRARDRAP